MTRHITYLLERCFTAVCLVHVYHSTLRYTLPTEIAIEMSPECPVRPRATVRRRSSLLKHCCLVGERYRAERWMHGVNA